MTTADAWLYAPREAVRTPGRGFGGGLGVRSGVQYPPSGAAIDYYLANRRRRAIFTMEILDAAGKTVRTFSSAGVAARRSRRRKRIRRRRR